MIGQQLELFPEMKKKVEVVQLKLFPEYEKEIDKSLDIRERFRKSIKSANEKKEKELKTLIDTFITDFKKISTGLL